MFVFCWLRCVRFLWILFGFTLGSGGGSGMAVLKICASCLRAHICLLPISEKDVAGVSFSSA